MPMLPARAFTIALFLACLTPGSSRATITLGTCAVVVGVHNRWGSTMGCGDVVESDSTSLSSTSLIRESSHSVGPRLAGAAIATGVSSYGRFKATLLAGTHGISDPHNAPTVGGDIYGGFSDTLYPSSADELTYLQFTWKITQSAWAEPSSLIHLYSENQFIFNGYEFPTHMAFGANTILHTSVWAFPAHEPVVIDAFFNNGMRSMLSSPHPTLTRMGFYYSFAVQILPYTPGSSFTTASGFAYDVPVDAPEPASVGLATAALALLCVPLARRRWCRIR